MNAQPIRYNTVSRIQYSEQNQTFHVLVYKLHLKTYHLIYASITLKFIFLGLIRRLNASKLPSSIALNNCWLIVSTKFIKVKIHTISLTDNDDDGGDDDSLPADFE